MNNSSQDKHSSRGLGFKLCVALIAIVVMLLGAEAISRFGFPLRDGKQARLQAFRDYAVHKRHSIYTPHPYTGYTPNNWLKQFQSDFSREKVPGVLRIACMGGSTTEGKNAWPHKLAQRLNKRSGQKVEVMNWGVSGWTTMESMLNYFVNVQDWQPDLVLVHHATNDVLPRMYPEYRTDYAHFRHPWERLNIPGWKRWLIGASQLYARIQMEGVPTNIQSRVGYPLQDYSIAQSGSLPVESNAAYQRNLRTLIEYTRTKGTRMALLTMPYNPNKQFQTGPVFSTNHRGTLEHNQLIRDITAESDCLLIDLAEGFAADGVASAPFFRDGVHLEPGGHNLKAKLVAEALIAAKLVGSK